MQDQETMDSELGRRNSAADSNVEINSGLAQHAFSDIIGEGGGLEEDESTAATTAGAGVYRLVAPARLGDFEATDDREPTTIQNTFNNYFELYMSQYQRADTLTPTIATQDRLADDLFHKFTMFQIGNLNRSYAFFHSLYEDNTLINVMNPINFESSLFRHLVWKEFVHDLVRGAEEIFAKCWNQYDSQFYAKIVEIQKELGEMKLKTSADDFVAGRLWRCMIHVYLCALPNRFGAPLLIDADTECSICGAVPSPSATLCGITGTAHKCRFVICTQCVGRSFFALSDGLRRITRKGVRVQCGLCRETFDAVHLKRYVYPPSPVLTTTPPSLHPHSQLSFRNQFAREFEKKSTHQKDANNNNRNHENRTRPYQARKCKQPSPQQ